MVAEAPPRPAPPPDERSDELSAVQIPDAAPGVICARGVCSVAEESAPEACRIDESGAITCEPNADASSERDWEYLWPRALLVGCSVLYGTNFPLGRLMNEALPAAASTSARFVLAGAALFPFLLQLAPSLRGPALRCGCFTALGYVSQSIALVDTPAATVAFLGALTVVVCPSLEATLDGRKLGFSDAPQVWLAAGLALAGVAVLELSDLLAPGAAAGSFAGDAWSVLQAVGFGTSFYLTERMMAKEPSQALPITAVQVFVTAAVAAVWAALDGFAVGPFDGGWLLDEASNPLGFGASSLTLPGLFLDPTARTVAGAAAWTGLMTTAANRVGETTALGRVSSAEASVLLATEPMFAAAFAALLIGEGVSAETAAGGALLVGACLANAQSPDAVREALGITLEEESAEAGSLQERVAAAVGAAEESQIQD